MSLEISFQAEKPHIKIEGVRYPAEQRIVLLLEYLFKNKNKFISKEQLCKIMELTSAPEGLRVYLSRTRGIIEPYGFEIKNTKVYGVGLFEVKEK